ncbi:FoF1 ATP synthase subunit gamma [Anaplasma phagocytophilum]|uniref:F0F1 ATP synthase subunit gamma n=1 Tax=Anaplasma phagocytophilum TaxID=948 RepID=UPI00200C4CFB|nr:FoF1 ATP synthase subunit gamma [Anaplasma phagocytophilum]UQD54636.1 F0F1 ATP synthase subunit gamma [Anaplasma phagocytophilum]
MASRKALSTRIRSVKSIQKTTRVMQMISASKFRTAREGLGHARRYCERVLNEAKEHSCNNVAVEGASGKLLVIFSSDRGLCGGFNHSVAKFLREYLQDSATDKELSFLFIGKKAYDAVKNVIADSGRVLGVVSQPKNLEFYAFKGFFCSLGIDFTSYKRVSVLYSKFHAINLQEQVIEDILTVDDPNDFYGSKDKVEIERGENLYDPDFASINTKLWFNSFMGRFYLSLCESVTCEHCCRMISMESANTNTKSMLNKLVLDYNRSRQAAITTDLIEVVSGCEALG